jgi:hypothetical protein
MKSHFRDEILHFARAPNFSLASHSHRLRGFTVVIPLVVFRVTVAKNKLEIG